MEESLHALESQVEQLNSVQSQNNMLQVLNTFPMPSSVSGPHENITLHLGACKACPQLDSLIPPG